MVAACRALLAAFLLAAACAYGAVDILTNNYDDARSGANPHETTLNSANVRPQTFGRLYSYAVDAPVFAQPLVVSGLDLGERGRHDVVYIATANNTVFAFDAADGTAPPLWQRALTRLPGGESAVPNGILGTPVIDRAQNVLYVVAAFADGERGGFALYALDLTDGHDRFGSPVAVAGSVRVDGIEVAFRPTSRRIAVQRAALALARGKVVVAFGGDYFEGWVFAFDQGALTTQPATFCTTCASLARVAFGVDYLDAACTFLGPGGGIWQAGRGPVVDAGGHVYFFTGNKAHIVRNGCVIPKGENACASCSFAGGCRCEGTGSRKVCRGPDTCNANESRDHTVFDTNESLVQLDPAHGLALTGWWRPANWNGGGRDGLEKNDLDLGGSGPLLIPRSNRVFGGGKEGVLYVIDAAPPSAGCTPTLQRSCLGTQPGGALVQSFAIAPAPPEPHEYYRHLLGGPVLWDRTAAAGGPLAFVWRENDVLRSYGLDREVHPCTPHADGAITHECNALATGSDYIDHHPGGILALSADGDDPASAIVWAYTYHIGGGPGRLMAWRALPEATTPERLAKLWDSDMCPEDRIDVGADFVQPTVANGRVYMATGGGRVDVFGTIPARECNPPPGGGDGPGPLLQ